MQTLDYADRPVSRNRAQTRLEADGRSASCSRTRIRGWRRIDTEGRAFGLVFWRFFLVEGEVETPRAEVVKFAEVARR